MTHLRKRMLEELQRRNYSQSTARCYIRIIRDFAKHFSASRDKLGPEQTWEGKGRASFLRFTRR